MALERLKSLVNEIGKLTLIFNTASYFTQLFKAITQLGFSTPYDPKYQLWPFIDMESLVKVKWHLGILTLISNTVHSIDFILHNGVHGHHTIRFHNSI